MDWVTYNRQRDILWRLGDPTVLVALTEEEAGQRRISWTASEALADDLQKRGFWATALTPAQAAAVTFDEQGLVRLPEKAEADYYVLGKLSTQQVEEQPQQGVNLAAKAEAQLVKAEDRRSLLSVSAEAKVSSQGTVRPRTMTNLLRLLAQQLGEELGPRLLRELMSDRPGAICVELRGVTDVRQVVALRRLLATAEGVERAAPLPTWGGRVSLAIATEMTPDALGEVIRQQAAEQVDRVTVAGRVVYVVLK
jgi:hypothetical protein